MTVNCRPVNLIAWNRLRYTLWAPLYDFVARFGRQRFVNLGAMLVACLVAGYLGFVAGRLLG